MADLSRDERSRPGGRSRPGDRSRPGGRSRRGDRGQLILIAAFALAVTFVALALVVNSAIFTENLASRGETAGIDDATYLRASVQGSVGEVVRSANVHEPNALDDAIGDGVANVSRIVERQQAARGAYVDVTYRSSSLVAGSRIAQNESTTEEFRSAGGAATWTLADDVRRPDPDRNGTRAFEMTVAKSSLDDDGADPFAVVVTDGSATWVMQLWRDGTGSDDVVVRVTTGAGATDRCVTTVPTATARIQVTRGTVDGKPCDALRHVTGPDRDAATNHRFASGVGAPYEIRYRNGDDVAGNYSLVTTDDSVGSTGRLNTGGSRASPYGTDAAYSVVVDYEFDRPRFRYATRIRVAPGEPS